MVDVKRDDPRAFEKIDLKLKELQGYEGRTGFFEDAAYPDGTKVAYVAAIQELGYAKGNIPPRPFMRPTSATQKNRWIEFSKMQILQVLKGKMTAETAMENIAAFAAEDVQQAIAEVYSPVLKPRTLAARRAKGNNSDKPLIDTKLMVRSVQGRAYKE